jgi:hypothetical protein
VVKYLPLHQKVAGLSLATAAGTGEREEKERSYEKGIFLNQKLSTGFAHNEVWGLDYKTFYPHN